MLSICMCLCGIRVGCPALLNLLTLLTCQENGIDDARGRMRASGIKM